MTNRLAYKLANLMDKAIPYLSWYARRLRSKACAYRLIQWQQVDSNNQVLYEHPLNADSTFVDLGGFRGDFSAEILARYQCRSLIFEPVPSYAKKIRKRFENNANAEVFDAGLAAEASTMTLSIAGESTSLYKSDGQEVKAKLLQFEQAMRDYNVESIDLLKINIEGGEYDLLEWLVSSDWIQRVDRLLVQFHDFVPNAETRRTELLEALGQTHEPYLGVPFVWECWSRNTLPTSQATTQTESETNSLAA
ncbi:MAG: FkbM family methyltransferase [Phycisphaeraceae bacterium]